MVINIVHPMKNGPSVDDLPIFSEESWLSIAMLNNQKVVTHKWVVKKMYKQSTYSTITWVYIYIYYIILCFFYVFTLVTQSYLRRHGCFRRGPGLTMDSKLGIEAPWKMTIFSGWIILKIDKWPATIPWFKLQAIHRGQYPMEKWQAPSA